MPTDRRTVDVIVGRSAGAGVVSAKAMFGAYGLYCDGRMLGIIGDGRLFIKPTDGGRAFAPDADEAPPYPGAKPCLVITPDRWDDGEWLADPVRITAGALPAPKAKPARRAARR